MADPISIFPVFVRNQAFPPSASGETVEGVEATLEDDGLEAVPPEDDPEAVIEDDPVAILDAEDLPATLEDDSFVVELGDDDISATLDCE